MQRPAFDPYQASNIGTEVSRSSDVQRRLDVEGMPPPDYFSSGASKQDSVRWQRGHTTQYIESRQSRGSTYSGNVTPSYGPEQANVYNDTCSIGPDDSMSVVSSTRSKRSKRSGGSGDPSGRSWGANLGNAEGASVYGARRAGDRGPGDQKEGYGDSGSGGWGADEQPYFDEANQCYVRNVRPNYTR